MKPYHLYKWKADGSRGVLVKSFSTYKALVDFAQRWCAENSNPKTRWMEYFDWGRD